MVKKSTSPIVKTERLLNLVPFLLTHQNISLKDLSAEFDLTEREMLDDLNTLWMCGLPGYTPLELIDLSFESGYVTISNAQTLQEVRSLTSDEVIVLLLGLDLVKSTLASGDIETSELIDGLRIKATQIVGDVVSVALGTSGESLTLVQSAMSQRRELLFTYLSATKDSVSTRRVIPQDIRTADGVSYLDGYCTDSAAFRTFRIERMSEISLGSSASPLARERTELTQEPTQEMAQIKVTDSPRKNSEKLGIDFSELRGAIGATVSVGYFDSQWLVRTALSAGGSLEIVAPEQARLMAKSRAQSLLKAYESGVLPF